MKEDRNILRDKLGNYAPETHRDLWPEIAAQIEPKSRKPVWIWWAAAAACLALLAAFWMWPLQNSQPQTPTVANQNPVPQPTIDTVPQKEIPTPFESAPKASVAETTPPEAPEKMEEVTPQQKPDRLRPKKAVAVTTPKTPAPQERQKQSQTKSPTFAHAEKTHTEPHTPSITTSTPTKVKPELIAGIEPVDTQTPSASVTPQKRKTQVVIVRKRRPSVVQKVVEKKKKGPFELNIGKINLIRISRKGITSGGITS